MALGTVRTWMTRTEAFQVEVASPVKIEVGLCAVRSRNMNKVVPLGKKPGIRLRCQGWGQGALEAKLVRKS